jgi:hypothetical protein
MNNQFFERPILNSPYEYPTRYSEVDKDGQPTQQVIESRRKAALHRSATIRHASEFLDDLS